MKTLILAAVAALATSIAFAGPLGSPKRAERVKSKIEKSVLARDGVTGIGITGCNPVTGQQDVEGDFVYCVSIYADSERARQELLEVYPPRTKINGVYVVIETLGVIQPQPRITVGN